MSRDLIRIHALVGLHSEGILPMIAGCVDEGMWEIEGQEDTDKRWTKCKAEFTGPVADEYTWREIVIEIPAAQVMRYFDTPTVSARVDTSEPLNEA